MCVFPKNQLNQNSTFETPKFSLIFQQKRGFASANPPVVEHLGLEPMGMRWLRAYLEVASPFVLSLSVGVGLSDFW